MQPTAPGPPARYGHGHGLQLAYLVMLGPLALSGVIVWRAVRYYSDDAARAATPNGPGTSPGPGAPVVSAAARAS